MVRLYAQPRVVACLEILRTTARGERMSPLPREGEVIISPQLPGPIWVRSAVPEDLGVRVEGVALDGERYYDRYFDASEFSIQRPTFDADGERFRLAALSEYLRIATHAETQFAVGASLIDPLPHQIDAVYNYMLPSTRIRFLLADDPGAGKTIMAGLLVKELRLRRSVERILVVVPANLREQWRTELAEKFKEQFTVLESKDANAALSPEFWDKNPRVIISIDLAKRDNWLKALGPSRWDLVIVDEAHKMAAYQYGAKTDKTKAYRLGEALRDTTEHLLLMTATPHRGRSDNYEMLLQLLDADLFRSRENIRALHDQRVLPFLLRRLKEDLRDFDGRPLFTPRTVETVLYSISGVERELYDELARYVSRGYKRADDLLDKREKQSHILYLQILQRRRASSLRAIRKTLERRGQALGVMSPNHSPNLATTVIADGGRTNSDYIDVDDASQEERQRWDTEDHDLASVPRDWRADIRRTEQQWIENLIRLARSAEAEADKSGAERKLDELRRVLQDPFKDGRDFRRSGERLLVFTENKDTHDYLIERFQSWGYRVASIHGGMNQQERRRQMQSFRRDSGPKVMVATEAAGEGINLQFCRLMVNYDLPWNPNRLEQRMGRVHRYGQKHNVFIYNLVSAHTVEGHVLNVLFKKLDTMRRDLGSDLVYDVLSDLLSEDELTDLIQEAIKNSQSLDDLQAAVERKLMPNEERLRAQLALQNALATDLMRQERLADIRGQTDAAAQRRRVLEDTIRDFTIGAIRALCADEEDDATIEADADDNVWRIERIPAFLRHAAPSRTFPAAYNRIVFRSDLYKADPRREFVTFGHPLLVTLLHLVRVRYAATLHRGARLTCSEATAGLLWLLQTTVTDRTGKEIDRWLHAIRQEHDGTYFTVDPWAVLAMQPLPSIDAHPESAALAPYRLLSSSSRSAEEWARAHEQLPRLRMLRAERARRADVIHDYLQQALIPLMERAQQIIDYANEFWNQNDPDIDEKIRRDAAEELREYQERLDRGYEHSETLRFVGANPPRVVGVTAILPPPPQFHWCDDPLQPEVVFDGAHGSPPPGVPTTMYAGTVPME